MKTKFAPALSGLELVHQGKVRDTFALPDHPDKLLVVSTGRISTHNVVHESIIPWKGEVLTALTVFWLSEVLRDIPNHLIAAGDAIFNFIPAKVLSGLPERIERRSIVVKKLKMLPIELVFRSRMAGSLWKDYYSKGLTNPYGLDLPSDMTLMSPFAETIFTPTEKSETDEPMSVGEARLLYRLVEELAACAYERGRDFAKDRGIEIIDGKFEVGIDKRAIQLVLADECLTPDSCRFVPSGAIVVGQEPPWLDKQYVREAAEKLWNGGPKVPLTFPLDVCHETTARYVDIYQRLTGKKFWNENDQTF